MSERDPVVQLFQKVDRQLAKLASKPLAKNVHQFRTATRRLEAVLEEFVPVHGRNRRKLLKDLSQMRRRAGRVRDLDVHMAALRNLRVPQDASRKRQVLRVMSEKRVGREKKLQRALRPDNLAKLQKRLKRAVRNWQRIAQKPDPALVASTMLRQLVSTPGPLTEKLLHHYRINGKHVRYVAELAQGNSQADAIVAKLQRMQDSLGEWHDWLTLTVAARKIIGETPQSPLISALNNITRAKFRDAVQIVTETKTNFFKSLGIDVFPSKDLDSADADSRRKPNAQPGQMTTAAIA